MAAWAAWGTTRSTEQPAKTVPVRAPSWSCAAQVVGSAALFCLGGLQALRDRCRSDAVIGVSGGRGYIAAAFHAPLAGQGRDQPAVG